ncbi:rhodanese-like domain-containing protein [Roseateles sp. BYS96W]|uniref:Rhodanese-like domain-containing protein n=1 Tax=Pelomonas nitida TaxID=3299027 RepID=A0ABW7G9Z4_9BURK
MLDLGRFPALLVAGEEMPTPIASTEALVHPHQIEVQEFSSYDLVIDARSPEAYQEDRIPGAVNIPVTEADRGVAAGSNLGVVRDVGPAMPYTLANHARRLRPGAAVLIYCDRGGSDSMVWAAPLRTAGFVVDVLAGGWACYRRWVAAGLEVLPRAFTFRLLLAAPVSGLSRVVRALEGQGDQVLDLTALAGQRLVPGLALPGDLEPSQQAFETQLLHQLRRLDPRRPVWVRVGLCGMGHLELPPALRDALAISQGARLVVPLSIRALAWQECLQAKGVGLDQLLGTIGASARLPKAEDLLRWQRLAESGRELDMLGEIISDFAEPSCVSEVWSREPKLIRVDRLTEHTLTDVIDALRAHDA